MNGCIDERIASESSNTEKKRTSSDSAKPVRLPYDVLVKISEKLMLSPDNEFRLDLRDFSTLNYMFVDRMCEHSFLFQLRQMTKLYLSRGGLELRSPIPVSRSMLLFSSEKLFDGPFNINEWFFVFLLKKDILRLKHLEAFFMLDGGANLGSFGFQIHKKKERASKGMPLAESLVKLFFFHDKPEELKKVPFKDLTHCMLSFDSVKITDTIFAFDQLDHILNLNPVYLHFECSASLSDWFINLDLLSRINANRTKHISFVYAVDIMNIDIDMRNFPHNQLTQYMHFITTCCPNLARIYVRFSLTGEFSDSDFDTVSQWLCEAIDTLSKKTLLEISFNSEINIAFHAFFPESTLMRAINNNHVLTRLGESYMTFGENELAVDEDLSSVSGAESNHTATTISRIINVDRLHCKRISYSLVGVQPNDNEDDIDWAGFPGGAPQIQPMPVNAIPLGEWNGFGSTDEEDDND
ncbi:hypothetical protein DdX_07538 [Ditylenchus destructor]|uniref:Uncharacterized protein n=1 Tax=Ditylenchus destructor TaxID=166010 RepID=A0AAD4NA14_9BILA|nr:hypothetical protein DdX_07538 [Ditylenchus destructor]